MERCMEAERCGCAVARQMARWEEGPPRSFHLFPAWGGRVLVGGRPWGGRPIGRRIGENEERKGM
jgi:hypothetical protein